MAVMIDIPGIGQVEAQNAASEATLKAILAAMSGGGRGGGGRGGAGGGGAGGGAGGGGAGGGGAGVTVTKEGISWCQTYKSAQHNSSYSIKKEK